MLLHETLELACQRVPDDPAVVSDGATVTFLDLVGRVRRLAGAVAATGDPGDRVAVLSENSLAFVDCLYGVPAAGRILVPLNHRLHPGEWADQLASSGSSVLIVQRSLLERLRPLLDRCPRLHAVVVTDEPGPGDLHYDAWVAPARDATPRRQTVDDRDVAWLLFTSGTTGRPKAAMLTHASLMAAVVNTALARGVRPDDTYLFPFPLYHIAAYNVVLFHLHARPVVLMARFDPAGVLELVGRHRATVVSLAPTMVGLLLDHPDRAAADLGALRTISYGASAMPGEILRRTVADLGCDLAQGYGMTELSGNAVFLGPDDHRRAAAGDDRMLAAAGRPGPLVAIRVVDDALADVPPGTPGEIVVRGDQVCAGYWDDPDATAATFAGGWLRTGDLGRLDADGLLSVVDRKKDVIVTGGENVASREVEDVLHRHPGVAEVAVIGIPDPTWGEDVCAVVVPRPGAAVEAAELVALAREHLAGFKKPKHVVIVPELPKNSTGKVRKQELRATIPSHLGR